VARTALAPFRRARSRARERGVRPDVILPFDMFDQLSTDAEAAAARKLEGIYHKGQQKAWDGAGTLDELLSRHGGIRLDPARREAIQGLFAVILWGELAAWKISADLALRLEPLEAKMAATSQAHDEARHFYVMHRYLSALGDVPRTVGPRTTRVLHGALQAGSLAKKVVGMQMMIEPLALALFQLLRESRVDPVLSELLELYERDEARHVALGVLHLPKLLRSMTVAETVDLYAWEFREYWRQLAMMHELEPHFVALDIDMKSVIEIGRTKQLRAISMLQDELGTPTPVLEAFVRFFDAKAELEFPSDAGGPLTRRLLHVWLAAQRGSTHSAPASIARPSTP
jgi:hypothetical protein